jgi:hypothetical protein
MPEEVQAIILFGFVIPIVIVMIGDIVYRAFKGFGRPAPCPLEWP